MKASLVFNLPEEQEEFNDAINGTKYKVQIEDIWNEVFRPFYKHGYRDEKLNELLSNEAGSYIMEALVQLYKKVGE